MYSKHQVFENQTLAASGPSLGGVREPGNQGSTKKQETVLKGKELDSGEWRKGVGGRERRRDGQREGGRERERGEKRRGGREGRRVKKYIFVP